MAPPHTVPTLPGLYGSRHGADCTARSPNPGGWEPAGLHSPTSFLLGDLRVWDGCAQTAKAGCSLLVSFSPIVGLGGLSLDQCPWLLAPGTEPQLTPKSLSAGSYTRGPTPTTSRSRPCVETGDILLKSQLQSGDRGRGVLSVCR